MNSKGEKLGWRELVERHSVQFYAWTILFAYVLNKSVNSWLMYEGNKNINSIYTYNYSIGMLGFLFLIPSAIIGVFIIKGWNKLIYSEVGRKIGLYTLFQENGFAVRGLNKGGRGLVYVVMRMPKVLWLTVKYTFLGIIYSVMFYVMIKDSVRGATPMRSIGGTSSSGTGSTESMGRTGSTVDRNKMKSDANFETRQAQKKADYAKNQAIKQGKYNANTHYFDSKVNHANNLQRKANEAAKRERNL